MKAIEALQKTISLREWREREFHFQEECWPIIKLKADVYAVLSPRIFVTASGVEHRYEFTPEQKECLDRCDELINALRDSYFPEGLSVRREDSFHIGSDFLQHL